MVLWEARASRFGVRLSLEPRKPIRSARVVSRVMRMMLGDAATGGASEVGRAMRRKEASKMAPDARVLTELRLLGITLLSSQCAVAVQTSGAGVNRLDDSGYRGPRTRRP